MKNVIGIQTPNTMSPQLSTAVHHLSPRLILVFFLIAVKKQKSNHPISIFFPYHSSKC